MHKFTYKISLRIRHPHLDPASISAKLELDPKFAWKAGDERRSPKGTPLKGTNRESYWSYALEVQQGYALVENLTMFLMNLKQYKGFFNEIRDTGGSIECFIGWFSGSNSGETFDFALLSLFGELKIDLSLDVYGQSESTVEIIPEELL